MNLGLYGYGPPHERTWLAVDFGVTFAGPDLPGVDLVFPDIAFSRRSATNLAGIVITHAHEDHFGALLDLWPRLRVPVYATAFTAGLLAAKLASEPGASADPDHRRRAPASASRVGPFEVEYINVAHSIPEPNALAIRTPLGTVIHTGDWKLDDTPALGQPTDAARLRGDRRRGRARAGLRFDQRHARGPQPERDRGRRASSPTIDRRGAGARRLHHLRLQCRPHPLDRARRGGGRPRGRGRRPRACAASSTSPTELGMLDGLPPFLDEEPIQHLPRDKVVAAPHRQPGRAARGARPRRRGRPPERRARRRATRWSSPRAPSPATRSRSTAIINRLIGRGIRVITDRDRLVHVSGHPRRDELRADVCLAEAADRDSGPWRADAPCRPCRTRARHRRARRCWTSATATMVRLAPGAGRDGRRGRRRPPLQGRQADRRHRGDRRVERRQAVLRRPRRSSRSSSTASGELERRSGDRADRRCRTRDAARPAARGDGDGGRSRHARVRSRARGDAIRTWCARRSAAPSGRRSPRPGARSRFARSSSRSYDARA